MITKTIMGVIFNLQNSHSLSSSLLMSLSIFVCGNEKSDLASADASVKITQSQS